MPRILIIEDNQDSRTFLARGFQRHGFDVVAAENGKDGIEKAKSDKPDLIVMDMNLPEMDGWEAAREIKKDEEMAGIPIVALTGHAMDGDRERAMEAGCTEFCVKPMEFEELLGKIEGILKGNAEG